MYSVYAFEYHGELVYIGCTSSLRDRMKSHRLCRGSNSVCHRVGVPFAELKVFTLLTCETKERAGFLECYLIRRLKPVWNRRKGPTKRPKTASVTRCGEQT